jgi:hypothetical protein
MIMTPNFEILAEYTNLGSLHTELPALSAGRSGGNRS